MKVKETIMGDQKHLYEEEDMALFTFQQHLQLLRNTTSTISEKNKVPKADSVKWKQQQCNVYYKYKYADA